MKKIKQRIVKVLHNYSNASEIGFTNAEIEELAVELEYTPMAKRFDDGKVYFFVNVSMQGSEIEIITKKMAANQDILEANEIKVLFIVDTISDKFNIIKPEYLKTFKKELLQRLGEREATASISDISVELVSSYNKPFNISISNRVDRLEYDLKEGTGTTALGHVYVASLVDIVNVYDKIGDALFDLNVRYSIKDILRVEKEIQSTLINCPEKFWFFNNGITLMVEDGAYESNKPYSISLKSNGMFSVINGAQTITTASKCINENPELFKKFKTAKVLLRIISVAEIESAFAKDVSLSLNRQKSITQVDIATSFEFVRSLNDIMLNCDNNDICFELSKRGGAPTFKYHYYIDEFAQIVEAYLIQKPGSARRNKNALIEIVADENKKPKLSRNDIFVELQSVVDIQKYYTPVNFSYELLSAYKKYSQKYPEGDPRNSIINYGRFYFVAAAVFCLNNKQVADFSDFIYLRPESNDVLIEKFISCFFEFIKSKKIELLDSNDFKNEKLYDEFKTSKHMELFYQSVCDIKQEG